MEEFINSNYLREHRPNMFVGVQKVGGESTGNRKCYLVRVPSVKGSGSSIRKCKKREEAEKAWREWEGWERFGGIGAWLCGDGSVPYRDDSYSRPRRDAK